MVSVSRKHPILRAVAAGTGAENKDPDMCPVARSRTLDPKRDAPDPAGFGNGGDILLPSCLVEIGGEKPAALVGEHRVDSDHVTSLQMLEHDPLGDRNEPLVRAGAAFYPGFVTQTATPFVAVCRRIAFAPLVRVDPELRINLLPSPKKVHKEGDFGVRRRRNPQTGNRWRLGRDWPISNAALGIELFMQPRKVPQQASALAGKLGQSLFGTGDGIQDDLAVTATHDRQGIGLGCLDAVFSWNVRHSTVH